MPRKVRRIGSCLLIGAGLTGLCALATPALNSFLSFTRAGTAFNAKVLCSGVLMAGMQADQLRREDLALGSSLIRTRIDAIGGSVDTSALFGLVRARAVRQGELGCSQFIRGQAMTKLPPRSRPESLAPARRTTTPWKLAPDAPALPPAIKRTTLKRVLDEAFSEPNPETPRRTRAVVVVQNGWVVAERYGTGIEPDMPLIGWSMTKSLTHALMGLAVRDGLLTLNRPVPVPEWSHHSDNRSSISLDDLLRMRSGLVFSEKTDGFDSDLVRMITQVADTGAFAADKPLEEAPGQRWSYASGTTNILSRGLRFAIGDDLHYWRYPYQYLFGPLGMHTAVMETDASGTFVGSSLGWASARDWARFGILYLDLGRWNGQQILPERWVRHATRTTGGSSRSYGAHWWINKGKRRPDWPKTSFSAEGFQGQLVLIAPSHNAVVVRLGQTPEKGGFNANRFGSSVLSALEITDGQQGRTTGKRNSSP